MEESPGRDCLCQGLSEHCERRGDREGERNYNATSDASRRREKTDNTVHMISHGITKKFPPFTVTCLPEHTKRVVLYGHLVPNICSYITTATGYRPIGGR